MKKRNFLRGMVLFFLGCFLFPASLVFAGQISVYLDEKQVRFDAEPVIENGRVLVPFRGALELMGYHVTWEGNSKTITTSRNGNTIEMEIGDVNAKINGQPFVLDVPPKIVNNRTLVPLRIVAEGTGIEVEWEEETSAVLLNTQEKRIAKLTQSVVLIQTNQLQGSGVVFSEDGIIATNVHVLENASTVKITFEDGSVYHGEVKVIGYDYPRDIVFLKIQQTGLHPVTFSDFSVKVGDSAFTIGSPQGVKNVVGTGSVTGVNEGILEITAPIQKGSSGGAVFDKEGMFLGITHLQGEKKNYAISLPVIQKTSLHQNLTLEQWRGTEKPLIPPDYFQVKKESEGVSVFWEPLYGVEGYHVYLSKEKNGTYEQAKNPSDGTALWKWGFPYSFGLSIPKGQGYYIKISSVKEGKESEKSQVVYLGNK